MRPTKDQTKHFLRIPPTNRRTKREDQPIPRTIPATLLWEPTERMGILATPSTIHPEFLAERIHKKIPLRADPRICTPGTPTIQRSEHSQHQQPTSAHQGSKRRSPTRVETGPRKDDQRNKVQ